MKKYHVCITAIVGIGIVVGISLGVHYYLTSQDIDECSIAEINPCGVNSLCLNTPSSYTCLCPVGFAAKSSTNPVCEKAQVETNSTPKLVSVNHENINSKLLVTPDIFCHSDKGCIEGLDCKNDFCHCPEGCEYIEYISSCDCGDYYDSDTYWDLSFVWPSIVGTFAGLTITCFWCICICETNSRLTPDDDEVETGEEQSLNPLPREINQTVVNEPVDVPVVVFSGGKSFSPYQDAVTPKKQASAPPYQVDAPSTIDGLSSYSPPVSGAAALPNNLDTGSNSYEPSTFTSASYPTNPPPFAPQPSYGLQPYDPQPSTATSAPDSYYLPPPSYLESLVDEGHLGKGEDTSSVSLK